MRFLTRPIAVAALPLVSLPCAALGQQPNASGVPASLLAVQGGTLYAGIGDRLAIFDLTDPLHPAFVGQSVPLEASIRSVAVNGTLAALVLTGGGLQLLDVSDRQRPVSIGSYPTPKSNPSAGVAF